MRKTIWWIRRDIRLTDNAALNAAMEDSQSMLPVFILDPILQKKTAPARQAFLWGGLRQLDTDLQKRGSRLVVRSGEAQIELGKLVQETGATVVYAEEDFSPYAKERDSKVSRVLALELIHGVTVQHPSMLKKPDGGVYRVYTPFSKLWKEMPFPGIPINRLPERLPPAAGVDSQPLPFGKAPALFPPGELEAQRCLDQFLTEPVYRYTEDRNRMDLDGTSQLSPYLRFGMLSARRAAYEIWRLIDTAEDKRARENGSTWLNELIWREFYYSILYHYPNVLREAFREKMRRIPWRDKPAELQQWKDGLTGFPVVDAAMRQLRQTGWMHNRARMITASFLVKDLLINWQEGERWFMEQLIDGDPACNNGGWQWTAGVGTDAAPYFRIFNPVSQGKKFDPHGDYVRRYVPELNNVPLQYIHEPGLMPPDVQAACGVHIGRDYPKAMVEHAEARQRTLLAYKAN